MFDIFNDNINIESPKFADFIKKNKANPAYLFHILPMLGAIAPIGYNSGYSMDSVIYQAMASAGLPVPLDLDYALPPVGYQFKTATGKPFSCRTLLGWIKYLNQSNYSTFIKSQTACPGVCSAVPLVLKAYKQEKGIKYSHWDKNDKFFTLALNHTLSILLDLGDIHRVPEGAYDELVALTVSNGNPTSYRLRASGKSVYKDFDRQSPEIRRMLLQTWVYHPSIRHEDMILDPEDWDIMPESLSSSHLLGSSTPWDSLLKVDAEGEKVNARDNLPW